MNPELLSYIQRQLQRGVSKETIKQMLLANGWQPQVVDEAIDSALNSGSKIPSPSIPMSAPLTFGGTLKTAWQTYKHRFLTITAIMSVPYILIFLTIFLLMGQTLFGTVLAGKSSAFLLLAVLGLGFLSIILSVVLFIIFSLLGQIALISAISNENVGFAQAYKIGLKKLIPFIWVVLLTLLVIGGGTLLLVIPGIIFGFWLMFSSFVLVVEGDKGMNALLKSREYIRGRTGKVAWFLIAFVLIVVFLQIILRLVFGVLPSQIGNIIVTLFTFLILAPFATVFSFSIYKNLREAKGQIDVSNKSRKWLIVFAVLGIVFTILPFVLGIFSVVLRRSPAGINNMATLNGLFPSSAMDLSTLDQLASSTYKITDWQTYFDNNNVFELKCPQGWHWSVYGTDGTIGFFELNAITPTMTVFVSNETPLSLEEKLKLNEKVHVAGMESYFISVDGVNGLKTSYSAGLQSPPTDEVYFIRNNKSFTFNFITKDKALEEYIISTIKFLS